MIAGRERYLHRLVMEILLGRMLRRDEHVHHLDGVKLNNRPANLQLLSAGAHMSQTHRRYPLVRFCHWCGNPFLRHHNGDGEQRFCSRHCGGRGSWQRRPRRRIMRQERASSGTAARARPWAATMTFEFHKASDCPAGRLLPEAPGCA
jgi:hypothetical protein